MPAIGYVTKQSNGGFKGQLKTLSIRADIEIVPNRTLDPSCRQASAGDQKFEVAANYWAGLILLPTPRFQNRKSAP
ncbi:MAG: hypothetical protein JWL66_993 [Sphingomonadales bacterium]|nr:hypothetical protein [Sphingomonadales bacterium]